MSRAILALVGGASAWKVPEYYENGAKWTDYKDDDTIVVHIVCHTHDDVGWLKNVDELYTGSKNTIAEAGVQLILDTVSRALLENPNRTFTYVEQAFFQRWWMQQNTKMRDDMKRLVANG